MRDEDEEDHDDLDDNKENSSGAGNGAPPSSTTRSVPLKPVNGEYAKVVPFAAVCQLFERSTRASKASTRKKDLQSFFGAYSDDDFFPLMRLLLPQLDKERQTYGMKESVLAKLYVQILGISPESDDGKRLIHWRRPNGGARSAQTAEAGDFGTAIYDSLRKRHAPPLH